MIKYKGAVYQVVAHQNDATLKPDDNFMSERDLIRKILNMAADKTADTAIKSWLKMDERGTWEKTVRVFLDKMQAPEFQDRMERLGKSSEDVYEEIATYVAWQALEASIRNRTKKKRTRR